MARWFRKKTPNAGFTLVEVLVAVSIFGISSLALMSLLLGAVKQASVNKKFSYAVILAQKQIEELRTIPYESIPEAGQASNVPPLENTPFSVSYVAPTDPDNADMKTVTITVAWEHKGVTQSYETQSIYTAVSL